jgi:hypothetical protein
MTLYLDNRLMSHVPVERGGDGRETSLQVLYFLGQKRFRHGAMWEEKTIDIL